MKTLASVVTFLAVLAGFVSLQAAQPQKSATAAFELPRLKMRGKPNDAQQMSRDRATVHDLSPGGTPTARAGVDRNAGFLALDHNSSWSSPLRGAAKDTTFISFFVYASEGTSIDIAGAKVLVRASKKAGYASLQVGKSDRKAVHWREVGGPVKFESFDGAPLAALPVLTARLDPKAAVWDLFVGRRLVATDLPLAELPKNATRQFTVRAGSMGARICGLISADDNPFYQDENANGIDDAFEKTRNGGAILAASTSAATRTQLARQWQQDQKARPIASLPVQRPLPDGAPSTPPGKGK